MNKTLVAIIAVLLICLVSVGVFGHIFTIGKEDLDEAMSGGK